MKMSVNKFLKEATRHLQLKCIKTLETIAHYDFAILHLFFYLFCLGFKEAEDVYTMEQIDSLFFCLSVPNVQSG